MFGFRGCVSSCGAALDVSAIRALKRADDFASSFCIVATSESAAALFCAIRLRKAADMGLVGGVVGFGGGDRALGSGVGSLGGDVVEGVPWCATCRWAHGGTGDGVGVGVGGGFGVGERSWSLESVVVVCGRASSCGAVGVVPVIKLFKRVADFTSSS